MSFDLISATPYLVALGAVLLVGFVLLGVAIADLARSERPVRLARKESISAYYGRRLLGQSA